MIAPDEAKQQDSDAFAELVTRYERDVFNLAYWMLGNAAEAEGAAQEAFLRAYKHWSRYDPERSFKTWLLSITSNHCIDRLRKRRVILLPIDGPLPPHPALLSPEVGPERAAIDSERRELIQSLLSELAPHYRAPVVLRYWYDMSYAEIAETMGASVGAIKSRLHRARRMLAETMQTDAVVEWALAGV